MKKNSGKVKTLLKKAKATVSAIVMDQDGTVKGSDDPKYKKANVAELLQRIARAGKYPAIITASGASALKSFSSMINFYAQEQISTPTFIGIGNGTALHRFDIDGRTEIYNHGLTLDEERAIIGTWEKIYKTLDIKEFDLQPKGIETFQKFMEADWTSYIPPAYIELFKQYGGRCFTEPIKVTVVFPVWEAERQRELIKQIQTGLDKRLGKNKYIAQRGDDTFLHITHSFNIDPKLFAIETIMKELDLRDENVVAFGDMPLDNDRGMLIDSKLPYTFTNKKIPNWDYRKPPFVLPGSDKSAVGSVYQAIDYLLR